MRCPSCNFENRKGVRFCENCGNAFPQFSTPVVAPTTSNPPQKQGLICPNCRQINSPEAVFCTQCGESFYEEDDPGEEYVFSFRAALADFLFFAVKAVFLVTLGVIVGWLIIFVF